MSALRIFTQNDIKELTLKGFKLSKKDICVLLVKWRYINDPSNGFIKRRILCALDIREKERSERFVREDDRYRALFSRGLVKLIGAHCVGVPVHEIRISTEKKGKPYFEGIANDLKFNISHSGEYILIAFAKDREIGADIEKQDSCIDFEGIAGFFSEEEKKRITEAGDYKAFYETWIRKEAFLKCTGEGLMRSLKSFIIRGDEAFSKKGDRLPISFIGINTDEGYSAVLAVSEKGKEDKCEF